MKNLIRLTGFTTKEIYQIFQITDDIRDGKYTNALQGKSILLFFPESSIRTRVTFEKGINQLGGQPILFPPETLDKKEDLRDVCGYLNNWADAAIVRHKDIHKLEKLAMHANFPIINAMTDNNHPCEILSDMYALSKIRSDFVKDKYLFCGINGNIGYTWKEASEVMGFELSQCCVEGYEIDGLKTYHRIKEAIIGKDIVCTDSFPNETLNGYQNCQVTTEVMNMANEGALLNPCPPFFREQEVSKDVIDSDYFVGYEFKKCLLEVQQAIILYCLL